MPSTVEQLSPTRVKITVEVPFADLKPSMDKAYAEIAQSGEHPGLPPGQGAADGDRPAVRPRRGHPGGVQRRLPRFYGAAVAENKLTPLAQPDVEVTKLEDGDLIEFTAEVDVRPEFDLPDLSTLQATVDAIDVPDDAGRRADRRRCGPGSAPGRPSSAPPPTATWSPSTWWPPRTASRCRTRPPRTWSTRSAPAQMLDGLDEAVTGLSAGESAELQLDAGRRPAEGRGGRHRGDGHQGAGAGAARGRRRVRPAGLGVRHHRRAAGRPARPARPTLARLEQATAGPRRGAGGAAGPGRHRRCRRTCSAAEIEARKQQINASSPQASLTLERVPRRDRGGQTEEEFWADVEKRSADGAQGPDRAWTRWPRSASSSVDQNDLTQHIIRKAQQEGTAAAADRRPPAGAPAPHRRVHGRDPPRQGAGLIVEAATVTDTDGHPVDLATSSPTASIGDPTRGDEDISSEADEARGVRRPRV